ncbi:IS30 family transposase [Bacteroides heparinolyticus]|uniref:IS30 family transposase n=1 Tax=Prevotella heparinolytica TaxID=28113 RepID=UPI00359FD705
MNENDRFAMEKMINLGTSFTAIANQLDVSISTISREYSKGLVSTKKGFVYRGFEGQRVSELALSKRGKRSIFESVDKGIITQLERLIAVDKYSPAAAMAALKHQGIKIPFCLKTLYSYIDKGLFNRISNLDLPVKPNKKRKYRKIRAKQPPVGDSIELRPKEVETRDDFGHWEMDLVIGHRSEKKVILSLTERKSRFQLLRLISRGQSSIRSALDELELELGVDFPKIFRTITVDNGAEFRDYQALQRSLCTDGYRTRIFYCHPYTPSERGTNEVQHRLLRRFAPKYSSLSRHFNQKQMIKVQQWMNNYPRRIFSWTTAMQVFLSELLSLGIQINFRTKRVFAVNDS